MSKPDLVKKLVNRMMQFRSDRVKAMIAGKFNDEDAADGLSRFDEAKALIAIVSMHEGPRGIDAHGDAGEGERLWGLQAGHVLTDQDVADIEKLSADYNQEIEEGVEAFHKGRTDALFEIGGKDLVAAVEAKDAAFIERCTADAISLMNRRRDEHLRAAAATAEPAPQS